ncbi:unnamed protein product [Caenorhabditis angaria]|uniref:Chloride channel protein n=1 Tax=Caenorhabditis angaria TaxID=860376 RepID=A0A9P1MWE4_9PELO|nr:unnamed protein product [Caenorhabditis angaria]
MGDEDGNENNVDVLKTLRKSSSAQSSSLQSDIVQFEAKHIEESRDHGENKDLLHPGEENEEEKSTFNLHEDYGDGLYDDSYLVDQKPMRKETTSEFFNRQYHNIVHFFVEDWFISAMLGTITAILSITIDIAIEGLVHLKHDRYKILVANANYYGFIFWVSFTSILVCAASFVCHAISKEAIGSGIPQVKVIIHGFTLKNYLSLKTLVAKIIGITLVLGSGLPVGKEGPFVHIGAIIATLLNRITAACQLTSFFSNEGRAMEMLSIGCAVGIACTFSAPMGAVLYGIESTSKYFAVKNYWRSFFATTCSALIFRYILAEMDQTTDGTIYAYYQTNFPHDVFVSMELGFFVLLGVCTGLLGALFVWYHRQIALCLNNEFCKKHSILITTMCAVIFAVISCPDFIGQHFAGGLTFRDSIIDFLSNCSITLEGTNYSGFICGEETQKRWAGSSGESHLQTLILYFLVYFLVVPICISLHIPSGMFVPCFVIGACGGRIVGEILAGSTFYKRSIIYPGLYAVVGAASFTGSVTHSLSIALIVCETTGQLCALLPVLIALMISNAICSFLQPSIYESIIKIKNYPYLADLPPSRVSVHQMKVDRIMVKDLVFITRNTTYRELREILLMSDKRIRSFPFVTDNESMTLLGSVARKYLNYLLERKIGPEQEMFSKRRSRTASELFNTIQNLRKYSRRGSNLGVNGSAHNNTHQMLTDRNISGNTLLPQSPLHEDQGDRSPLAPLLYSQNTYEPVCYSLQKRNEILSMKLDMLDVAIDPAPFQLVPGTSLYKVHTLFSLLALNHAYVTEKGRLVGVVAVSDLRRALNDIYSRGAVVPKQRIRTSTFRLNPDNDEDGEVDSTDTTTNADTIDLKKPRVTIEIPDEDK